MNLYWGDLHNHNAIGYGQGSLDRSYRIARGSLLDAYCFTPHGRWHDLPANDPALAEHHRIGFENVQQAWPDVVKKANTENHANGMVCFNGFEWHSSRFGDYHVLLPGNDGNICAPDHVRDLQAYAKEFGAVMIPHHIAYQPMWRGISWKDFQSAVSPVADVFSEHGCSMEPESHHAMLLHSMGGSQRSQTFMEQLKKGITAGVIASTDNHYGHPASYGEGLAGIRAADRSRESILSAIQNRHTYAVTGDRIRLDVRMGSSIMGDILPVDSVRELHLNVAAMGAIDYVRVIKNSTVVFNEMPMPSPLFNEDTYMVRIEFGWDSMASAEVTDWKLNIAAANGIITAACPCFAGGDGSVEKINRVDSLCENNVSVTAFTSRRNSRPTSSVVLELRGTPATEIFVSGEAEHKNNHHPVELSGRMESLLREDRWTAISDVFSSPRLCIGNAAGSSQTTVNTVWTDPNPGGNDWYLVKVQQKNGHIAWSSPIWCRNP